MLLKFHLKRALQNHKDIFPALNPTNFFLLLFFNFLHVCLYITQGPLLYVALSRDSDLFFSI